MKIWSIILAAGESKRMGSPKMLLKINGKTMIENVIEHVAESESDGILVVLGAYSAELKGVIGRFDLLYCVNGNYKDGMLSSVQCGLKNLPQEIEAVLIFQGDQPFISTSTVNIIIHSYRITGKGIVVPLYKGKRGHPLLLDRKYLDEIETLDPDEGLRAITRIHSRDLYEAETNDPGILRDIDTYDDYLKETNQTD